MNLCPTTTIVDGTELAAYFLRAGMPEGLSLLCWRINLKMLFIVYESVMNSSTGCKSWTAAY